MRKIKYSKSYDHQSLTDPRFLHLKLFHKVKFRVYGDFPPELLFISI